MLHQTPSAQRYQGAAVPHPRLTQRGRSPWSLTQSDLVRFARRVWPGHPCTGQGNPYCALVPAIATGPRYTRYVRRSLSVRVAESLEDKQRLAVPFSDILRLASHCGFEAISMRASVVSVDSPSDVVAEVARQVRLAGLAVSMVTGSLALALNDAHAPDALRHIKPHLDLADALDCRRVRVMMQTVDDISYAQRAADEARERGILLCHQTHARTLFETVEECLSIVSAVGRPNLGITFEPAQLHICGDDYGPSAILRLAPHLFNVYLQNWSVDPDGSQTFLTNRGPVRGDVLPLDARNARGVDLDTVFKGLRAADYAGWVTVHATRLPGLAVDDSIRRYGSLLRAYTG